MKRFQPGLKREARPGRHGREEADWGLQIKNEKSSRLWGWEREEGWGQQRPATKTPTTQFWLWGSFETGLQSKETAKALCCLYEMECKVIL
jgi:hypothetical protein